MLKILKILKYQNSKICSNFLSFLLKKMGNSKKHGPIKKWLEEEMEKTLNGVKDKGMPLRETAKQCKVPQPTLFNHLNGKYSSTRAGQKAIIASSVIFARFYDQFIIPFQQQEKRKTYKVNSKAGLLTINGYIVLYNQKEEKKRIEQERKEKRKHKGEAKKAAKEAKKLLPKS